MIAIGLPCDYCHMPTVAHCKDGHCKWSRCPRCSAYGIPGRNFLPWNREDFINPYTLLDIEVAEPQRILPEWLEGDYGTPRQGEAPTA